MRHNYKGRKLGTDFAHTKAMKRSLVQALFLNDRIKTIESRAKEIRPDVDKIITWAKKGDLHSRRLAIAALGNDKELVREIFEKVEQGMFRRRLNKLCAPHAILKGPFGVLSFWGEKLVACVWLHLRHALQPEHS